MITLVVVSVTSPTGLVLIWWYLDHTDDSSVYLLCKFCIICPYIIRWSHSLSVNRPDSLRPIPVGQLWPNSYLECCLSFIPFQLWFGWTNHSWMLYTNFVKLHHTMNQDNNSNNWEEVQGLSWIFINDENE